MSDYGLKISLPGYDVSTATPEQCSVHSGYTSPKIDTSQGDALDNTNPQHYGTVTVTFVNSPPSGTDTVLFTIPHNYGYIPSFLGNATFIDGAVESGGLMPLYVTGSTLWFYMKADASNVYVMTYYDNAYGSLSGTALYVSYMVFAEEAT